MCRSSLGSGDSCRWLVGRGLAGLGRLGRLGGWCGLVQVAWSGGWWSLCVCGLEWVGWLGVGVDCGFLMKLLLLLLFLFIIWSCIGPLGMDRICMFHILLQMGVEMGITRLL